MHNGATVDENLINLERGHPRCQVSTAAFPSRMLCLWTGSMSRGQFLSFDVVSFGGPCKRGCFVRFGGLVGSFSAALARGALAGVWGATDLGSGSGEWRVSRKFPLLCQLLLACDVCAVRFAVQ